MGDVVRVGVRPGDDRRLATRLRRPADHQRRVLEPGSVDHRHTGGGAWFRRPDPGLPAGLVDHPRIRAPSGCAIDVRLAGSDWTGRRCVGGPAVCCCRLQCGNGGDRGSPGLERRADSEEGCAVRGGGADGDLDRGVGRRLLRRSRRLGYRAVGSRGPRDRSAAGAGRRGRRSARRMVGLPQLRAGADGAAGRGRAGLLARLACRTTCAGAGRRRGVGRGGDVHTRRFLVVRRLHPCPATVLARYRQPAAVPVLELGEPGISGVRNRPR